MCETAGAFWCEIDGSGVRVTTRRSSLSPICVTPEEIDSHIERLKADLDEVSAEMKRTLYTLRVSDTAWGE